MNSRRLGKHVCADNGRIRRYPLTRKIFDHAAERSDAGLIDGQLHAHFVFQGHCHLGERGIARAFTQAVHRAVNSVDAHINRRERVRRSEAVVVVRMEIEGLLRKPSHHIPKRSTHLFR